MVKSKSVKHIRTTDKPVNLKEEFREEYRPESGNSPWEYMNVWFWLNYRIQNNDVSDIKIGDWIPINVMYGGNDGLEFTFNMEISRIKTDITEGPYGHKIPRYIDFISKELSPWQYCWNMNSPHCYSSDIDYPWLGSDIYKHLNNTVFFGLPEMVRVNIIQKELYIERRVCVNDGDKEFGNLATGEVWCPIGWVWLPNETETFGFIDSDIHRFSSKKYGAFGEQYETLNTEAKRSKKCAELVGMSYRDVNPYSMNWMLLSTCERASCIVGVDYAGRLSLHSMLAYMHGIPNHRAPQDLFWRFPICFRIG